MKNHFVRACMVLVAAFLGLNSAYAGFLGTPLYGYTPYAAPVSAVMDHDSRWNYIQTYAGESGSYWDGCLAYYGGTNPNRPCNPNDSVNKSKPWGYKKSGGGNWTVVFNYNDYASPSGKEYMWYDNHHGYDYAVPQWTPVLATASGQVVSYTSSVGQIKVDHGNGYRTAYTHMNAITVGVGSWVSKGTVVGYVSNIGAAGIHLHFEVERFNPFILWYEVDPYGDNQEPVLWE